MVRPTFEPRHSRGGRIIVVKPTRGIALDVSKHAFSSGPFPLGESNPGEPVGPVPELDAGVELGQAVDSSLPRKEYLSTVRASISGDRGHFNLTKPVFWSQLLAGNVRKTCSQKQRNQPTSIKVYVRVAQREDWNQQFVPLKFVSLSFSCQVRLLAMFA